MCIPRLAGQRPFMVVDYAGFIAMLLRREKCGGIDQDGVEVLVHARGSTQHQQAGL